VLLFGYAANTNLLPATTVRIIANVLIKDSALASEMGALGGYHLGRHESNYQRSPLTLGWTFLNFDIETNEETFSTSLFEI